jgi:hypothetical protein
VAYPNGCFAVGGWNDQRCKYFNPGAIPVNHTLWHTEILPGAGERIADDEHNAVAVMGPANPKYAFFIPTNIVVDAY